MDRRHKQAWFFVVVACLGSGCVQPDRVDIAPDGKTVIVVQSAELTLHSIKEHTQRKVDLKGAGDTFTLSHDGKRETRDQEDANSPRYSPDGNWIAVALRHKSVLL